MVSNPSRDYSAFLRFKKSSMQSWKIKFQTLPGIIPRFYNSLLTGVLGLSFLFQTLPGIIPRFYGSRRLVSSQTSFKVSNPSRDYSAFLR
ncbi:hypothetical protein U27_06336 [Candidatus Vecturithrix granuli]|uniref:Uncharacterized protein n=1 Tax=Vecturithrix granuli TaxID=1499967 RepID=A0A081C447_VECG1|nr:hypothetical protein U27_06336 [Candidatus Vecturithrix granuli]